MSLFRPGFDVDLTLNFLFKSTHTDVAILKDIKTATEGRSNVLHNATVVAHAYMNAGTFALHVATKSLLLVLMSTFCLNCLARFLVLR